MNFKKYINEMSITKKGDWTTSNDFIGEMRRDGLVKYNLLYEQDNIKFYQLRNSLTFIVGFDTTEIIDTKSGQETKENFKVIFKIQFTRVKKFEKIGYNRMIKVNGVVTDSEYQRMGIAKQIYKTIVNELNYTIVGDEEQYFGTRKLWTRLSNEVDINVDIININSKEIIYSDVVLHHGKYDEDFDERVWSYGNEKKNIRPILTKIK
jgi:hypothetical protein